MEAIDAKSPEAFSRCLPLFEAMKDENRQGLLMQVICRGEMTMTELAETSELSRTAVSHHVKILKQCGLISVQKKGTSRIVTARADESLTLLKELVAALEADLAHE